MDQRKLTAIVLSAKISWISLFESDSEDEDIKNPKNLNYFENTVCSLNDQQFKAHFRMVPSTFELLFQNICNIDSKYVDVAQGHPRIAFEKQLLMTIWYLANTECFRSVSDRFGVSISACWNIIFDICKQILTMNYQKKIIAWPSVTKALETSIFFQNKTKFPGIIGCIDGSHIAIPAPHEYANSYVNRKKFHSVLLQGVCDQNMNFIDCYAGEAGSIHDSCLFRRSNLFTKISNDSVIIPDDQHMVGDLGYGLKSYLMTPYKDTGNLTREQGIYNKAHSSARITIERAFGLLKGRFRRLDGLNTRRSDLIPLIIMTTCILHNICLQNGDNLLHDFIINPDDGSSDPAPVSTERNCNLKRNQILRILNN